MPLKHLLILLFIAFAYGSAFPITKLALNNSVPPILMASLRMGIVLLILIPFWRFKIPKKKYFKSLIAFSISMGVMVYVFMTLSLFHSSIISPVIVGSQLAIPFGGIKDSGYGKEAGIESIKEYTRIKTTWFNSSEDPMDDPFTMG